MRWRHVAKAETRQIVLKRLIFGAIRQEAEDRKRERAEEARRREEQARERKRKRMLAFSHILRKTNRSQVYEEELRKHKRKFLRRWHETVSWMKRFEEHQDQQKLLEWFS